MEMNTENPFKDCTVLKLNGETTDPTIVYLDDEEMSNTNNSSSEDENSHHPLHVKVSSEFDDESNQSMVVEPDDQFVVSEVAVREENSNDSSDSSIEDICLKFEPPDETIIPPLDDIPFEEQFELIPNTNDEAPIVNEEVVVEKPEEKAPSEHDQSFESGGSASNDHDHSYSQTHERSSYCDDIVENILSQADLRDNPKAVELLSKFTEYVEIFTSNDDPNSQTSQFVQRMKDTLLSKGIKIEPQEKELPTDEPDEEIVMPQNEPEEVETETNQDTLNNQNEDVPEEKPPEKQNKDNQLISCPSLELFTEADNWDSTFFESLPDNVLNNPKEEQQPMEVPEEITPNEESENNNAMDLSIEVVKEEPMENDVIVENMQTDDHDDKKVEIKPGDSEKLQECIRCASDVGNLFTSIQDLSKLVYETEEDVKTGKSKLLTSLQSIIKQSCKVMMEIEDVEETSDKKIDEFIDSTMLNLSNVYNGIVKKEEKKSECSESSDGSETDDEEINKLCNINALKISKGNRELEKCDTVSVTTKKLTKKKEKKLKLNSDDSDMLSTDDEDNNNTQLTSKKSDSEKENSSDEEEKMIEKHESNVKNMLLVSTDDESDESTYATSESSMGDLSSDDEKSTKTKNVEKKDKVVSDDEKEKEIKEPAKPEPQTPTKEITIKDSESESSIEKEKPKPKPRQMDGTTKEIFKKDFLDLDSSFESESPKSEKPRPKQAHSSSSISKSPSQESTNSTSQPARNENDVIDLSQYTARQSEIKSVDLTKYIEKKITEKITDQQQSTKPQASIDDDDCFIISSDSDSEVSSTHEKTRRRKELSPEELKEETKKAQKAEKERIKKLEKKKDVLSQYMTERLSQQSMDDDIICENDLILDYSKKQKKAIEVNSTLVDKLKEHQKEGIRFMYDNCFGNVDEVKTDNGSGCILAHCMGLGKTLQLITLIHTLTRYPELNTDRILVICPKTTIYNWFEEFQKWLTGLPSRGMKVSFLEENMKIEQKIKKLEEWFESKNPSVFLINYESFRSLVNWSGSHKKAKITLPDDVVKKYQDKIAKYLLDPGPALVVCDEGHMMKNQKGAANRAISKVKTRRRIILTGTPIQNNLAEYYAMVHWIKPCYLGDIKEFNNLYANPIKEGQLKDSTPYQIKKMKQKCFVLNKMLDKFVQRREASILKEFLPEKYEYCLFVPLTEPQADLYKKFLEANPFSESRGKQLLPDYTALRKIWTHPRVLQIARDRALRGENKFAAAERQKKIRSTAAGEEDDEEVPDDIHDTSQGVTSVTNNWWSSIADADQLMSLYSSHKLLILFELLKQAQMRKEKVLVFTAFVAVLDVIEQFMREIDEQYNNPKAMLYGYDEYRTTWKQGKDYLRLDGSTPRDVRHKMIKEFNNPDNTLLRCFLISAKAGGQGINLIGANRCVLIDTSWNPSSDQQNIFRIFRLGQKKPCYVYRLVALGTMEEKIYSRSVTKQAMSGRVVDRQIIDRHYRGDELEQLYHFTEYDPKFRETPVMPQDDILKFLLKNYHKQIYKYHEHDSLLENKPEQDLSEFEKKEAWDLYENEQRAHANRMNPLMGPNMYPQYPNDLGNYANEMMNLNNILNQFPGYNNPLIPTTSANVAGMDFNALSKSYYPSLTSSLYSNEFYKKFQQVYDPMNLYAQSSLPLPPVSTITSSSSSALPTVSTNSTNSLMSSLLRSPLAPPTAPPAHSLSSVPITYNANNIPPSSTSIFAPSKSSSNPTSISSPIAPTTSAAALSKSNLQNNARSLIKSTSNTLMNKVTNLMGQKRPNILVQKKPTASPILAKGSSANLSILPDSNRSITGMNGNRNPQIKAIEKSKSFSPTSQNNGTALISTAARTNSPYVRKTSSATVRDQLKKTASVQLKTQMKPASHTMVRPMLSNPRLQVPSPTIQKKVPFVSPTSLINRPEFARKLSQLQRTPNASASGVFPKRTSIDPAIQKQLEKNQTSMTEAVRPMQTVTVIGKNPENSVSIIAIKGNASTSSQVRVQKQPSQNAEIAITPLMTPPSNAKKIVQTPPAKITTINRPTSGTKVVISPQYSQGNVKRVGELVGSPIPTKKMRVQVPQVMRTPNSSQPQIERGNSSQSPVTSRTSSTQLSQSKRPNLNMPLEIVELE